MSLHPLLAKIFEASSVPLSELTPSSGGIWIHTTTKTQYFTKVQSDVEQMRGEIEGLRAMALTAPSLVPKVFGFEISDGGDESGMVTHYFKLTSPPKASATQVELGKKLAEMHTVPSLVDGQEEAETPGGYTGQYGFNVPTHCGVTKQENTWTEGWEEFFRDRRLGDIVSRIGDAEIEQAWGRMKGRAIPLLLHRFDPPPKPVIIHGDLWSGNKGYDSLSGAAVMYDPASYWGHNEVELGVTHMFGGFTKDFYEAYHAVHPKSQPHYDERQKLYELYHHLNHTLMFGGGYKSGALSIMRSLNAWAEKQEYTEAKHT